MIMTLLAKGVTDLTFTGAFFWYLVKFIVSGVLAFCAILLGIKLRKKKINKTEQESAKTAE
ncbi:MAG: hypothetical protein SO170_10330 [Butyribacter sp.]|nr:hypothetical protein [bacterium]MDY3855332.1 hypothetical protein [Butyribacter sp.]